MKWFFLDKKQNKVYCFHPSTKKDMKDDEQKYIEENVVRITKADAIKAFKENTHRFTLAAMEELNIPYRDVRLNLDHANLFGKNLELTAF